MRANKIKIEYLHELLGNVKLVKDCNICKSTLQELKEWVYEEMKRENWS